MKIVHFADLHLDAPFAWVGASGEVARRRRQALRETLLRIVELTKEVGAGALFCGGDLYEHERFTPDTAEFLRTTFQGLAPTPVYLAPGNHDWYGPQSLYALVDWSPNVHIFRESSLRRIDLEDGLTLWGGAHLAPANTGNFLDGFKVDGSATHIALFHGAERSWFTEQGSGKLPHAPFDSYQIEQAGLKHAFLGHYHRPKDAERHTYPGNPDPLEFGEDGERGAVIATIGDGLVAIERRRVAVTVVRDLVLDVTECTSQQQIRERLAGLVGVVGGLARLTVCGELAPSAELREEDLRSAMRGFESVQIRIGDLRAGYDIDAIRAEQTVRGQFVNDVLSAGMTADIERRVLMTGLRALDGRSDLEVI
ncbi:MAG: metallophosphoesterase [Dehalococcoidia bacterium]|nr:metallophosphoesterase [Dehalococcoidia bacterium]